MIIKVILSENGKIPPRGSRYWVDHIEDWNKLREYREDRKSKQPQLKNSPTISINLEEWAQSFSLSDINEAKKSVLKSGYFKLISSGEDKKVESSKQRGEIK